MDIDYIDNEQATKVRVHQDGSYRWLIDAANEHGHTEVCWDSRVVLANHKGDREWSYIKTVDQALELVPYFVVENVPHLRGEPVEVIFIWPREEPED